MRHRGLTLIELLVVLGINGLLVTAIVAAYQVGMRFQQNVPQAEVRFQADMDFERRLETLFRAAYLSSDDADATTYFLMYASGGNLAEPDTLVMTCVGIPPIGAFLNSEEEFEDLNDQFGPQGGIVEISISTYPVGDAPVDRWRFLCITSFVRQRIENEESLLSTEKRVPTFRNFDNCHSAVVLLENIKIKSPDCDRLCVRASRILAILDGRSGCEVKRNQRIECEIEQAGRHSVMLSCREQFSQFARRPFRGS